MEKRMAKRPPGVSVPAQVSTDKALVQMEQAQEVKTWLDEHPELASRLSGLMNQSAALRERAQQQAFRSGIILAIVSALLGWLLSAIATPSSLLHYLLGILK